MPKKGQKKTEVRVFLEGVQLKVVDELIGAYGSTRSEVIRNIIQTWMDDNSVEKLGKNLIELAEEAEEEGYISREESGAGKS